MKEGPLRPWSWELPWTLLRDGFLAFAVDLHAAWMRGSRRRRGGCGVRTAAAQKRHSELRRAGSASIEEGLRLSVSVYGRSKSCNRRRHQRIQLDDVNAQKVEPSRRPPLRPDSCTCTSAQLDWGSSRRSSAAGSSGKPQAATLNTIKLRQPHPVTVASAAAQRPAPSALSCPQTLPPTTSTQQPSSPLRSCSVYDSRICLYCERSRRW
jgi:hypothetical protein